MVSAWKLAIMMPPVSVCHQLSWIGRPKASTPQTTPSGFNGSPTLATNRSDDMSYSLVMSVPAFVSMRIAVGAVYQTVTRLSWMIPYHRSASSSPSSTRLVTPCTNGAMIPYEVPVTHPGSAVHQKMSSACRSRA